MLIVMHRFLVSENMLGNKPGILVQIFLLCIWFRFILTTASNVVKPVFFGLWLCVITYFVFPGHRSWTDQINLGVKF